MTIYWTRPTESGIGDRLIDVLYVATYAKIMKSQLLFTWEAYRGHEKQETRDLDPSHRYIDSKLDNVKKYINFPSNVKVVPFVEINKIKLTRWVTEPSLVHLIKSRYDTFEHAVGGAISPGDFWRTHLKDKLSLEEFKKYFEQTASEFTFCEEINLYLSTLPERFMTFHIRRGDKVRKEATDGTYIHSDELNELNELTHKCLHFFSEKYDYFFICSDEDEKKNEFTKYLVSKGKNIISIPNGLQKWQQTYYDMATMTKSEINLVANRYSAFSRFPSLIRNRMFLSVFQARDERYIT